MQTLFAHLRVQRLSPARPGNGFQINPSSFWLDHSLSWQSQISLTLIHISTAPTPIPSLSAGEVNFRKTVFPLYTLSPA